MNSALNLKERTIINVTVNLEINEENEVKEYLVDLAPAGKYPITKEFYYELDDLSKNHTELFNQEIATILRLSPKLQVA